MANDQTFKRFKSRLVTTPKIGTVHGDPVSYTPEARPGVTFLRPWLAVPNGPVFQWPLGLQGYDISVNPTLGVHKFIGDNKVAIDVIHVGEERITLTGSFPGDSAPRHIAGLRKVVLHAAKKEGKVLYFPEIFAHAQRVQVASFQASRAEEMRGKDGTYRIELVRTGLVGAKEKLGDTVSQILIPAHLSATSPTSIRYVVVDQKHNTLRKISQLKFGNTNKWQSIYNKNKGFFISRNVALNRAPDYKIPNGTFIFY